MNLLGHTALLNSSSQPPLASLGIGSLLKKFFLPGLHWKVLLCGPGRRSSRSSKTTPTLLTIGIAPRMAMKTGWRSGESF